MKVNSGCFKTIVIFICITILFTACSSPSKNISATVAEETPKVKTSDAFVTKLSETGLGIVHEVPAQVFVTDKPIALSETSDFMRWVKSGIGEADVRWLD